MENVSVESTLAKDGTSADDKHHGNLHGLRQTSDALAGRVFGEAGHIADPR
jgi:hypothetical protein